MGALRGAGALHLGSTALGVVGHAVQQQPAHAVELALHRLQHLPHMAAAGEVEQPAVHAFVQPEEAVHVASDHGAALIVHHPEAKYYAVRGEASTEVTS